VSIYADSSFLVSLYASDAHTSAALRFMRKAELPILLTPLNEVELLNALHLRLFRRELDGVQVKSAVAFFRHDIESGVFSLRSLSASTLERAKSIVRNRTPTLGTRTFDVIHVASALVLHANAFCTFDKNQKQLAKEEGLTVPV
jgi:predicted nucleic acid-binding protein